MNSPPETPCALGGPPLRARLRASAEDFRVDEELGFVPTGSGEHAFLWVEKIGTNTDWLAAQIARFAGVAPMAVGYSGLKDRHAITRQFLTVHLPGRPDPDWSGLDLEGVRILDASRHNRKLKRGSHRGNRFVIRLRDVRGDRDEAERRIATLRERGVPNYFGEQRFGREGGNIALAQSLFRGRRLGRAQRGIALSAARSAIFNAVLARRVRSETWELALPGEVWMLAMSNAIFGPVPIDAEMAARHAAREIQATGPLWGAGTLRSEDEVAALESDVAAEWPELANGLVATDLKQERRKLCLRVADPAHAWIDTGTLELEFSLPSGCYATTVLAELCDWHAHED